jgi:diketogulonate reductase-like aldo/keto reductase
MEYKRLGSSSERIPVIGLGTWKYFGGVRPLRAAIACGARFIDTAESYGTEEVVGDALQGQRAQVFLATKVRPRNFRYRDLIAAAEGSLRRLRTHYIDLYQLHWPNYTVPIQETMAAMETLVDAGKVRFIGVSGFSLRELEKAQSALSKCKIVSNQVRYSLIERTIEQDLLNYCQPRHITVIAFSPLGTNFARIKSSDPQGVLSRVAKEYSKTEAQIALNWLIAKDNVVVIPRASTTVHAVEDCRASGWRLKRADYDLLDAKITYRKRSRFTLAVKPVVKYLYQLTGRHL